ncbi:MAG: efflux RND transporter permease subunit [Candidatus Acidiferrales bacterium]|jgi:multidrug efflux pump
MRFLSLFIRRPVATTLVMAAITLAGAVAFSQLPVAPLPQVDFPTISVQANLPGASPENMAASVAAPLERQFGRISGVTEMTSASYLGSTSITLQFDIDRNIDGAARDVQAAINAARSFLPANMPTNPIYRKINPADIPVMDLTLTSNVHDVPFIFDAASTILQQRLSQIPGVGQVMVNGGALPAVRVELNPTQLSSYGLGLQDVSNMLRQQNANLPKGQISDQLSTADILSNDQLMKASDYKDLTIGYHNGAAVRLSDVADVQDSVQNLRVTGFSNERRSVLVLVFRQPGANLIDTVERIHQAMPSLKAEMPAAIDVTDTIDRTAIIRESVRDVEGAMGVSIALVILVVFVFLRNVRATLIATVAVPVSLIGTCGVMYLLHYSVDNLSLMALTISTGFVVDDAIVVIENVNRHLEQGMRPLPASLLGGQEIGFTVLSMSTSLIAVFIPILMMGGMVGRLFREFAVTLSAAIVVSLIVSLTLTPMLCSRLLREKSQEKTGWLKDQAEKFFVAILRGYDHSLGWVLQHPAVTMMILGATILLNVFLFVTVKKGFFPQQDNGTIQGTILAPQDISYQAMKSLTDRFVKVIKSDPGVGTVMGFTGGYGATNTAGMYIALNPLQERKVSSTDVVNRLRPKLVSIPGASVFLRAGEDLRVGGRQSNATYQYTILSENVQDLVQWGPIVLAKMKALPGLTDVNSDQQNEGLQTALVYDRPTASRMGITPQMIDNTLYDAFGQAEVSTIYKTQNQYYVVMEVAPQFWQDPRQLANIYVKSAAGQSVPLSAIAQLQTKTAPLSVNHQGQFPSVTISFNLAPGVALSDAAKVIDEMEQGIGMPETIHGMFAGTLQAFQESLSSEPLLLTMAILAVYIVLGMLYESFIHPITILSTLPSAGVGAILALLLFRMDLTVISMIGIVLLIGIVKKNAILMIDFALTVERQEGKRPLDAIYRACLLRFRPILMTTMAALFGALPLAVERGMGSELRRPLAISIIGGLLFSQILTLYTTPVVYLYADRFSHWWAEFRRSRFQFRVEQPGD